jgi:hypothetical protein
MRIPEDQKWLIAKTIPSLMKPLSMRGSGGGLHRGAGWMSASPERETADIQTSAPAPAQRIAAPPSVYWR